MKKKYEVYPKVLQQDIFNFLRWTFLLQNGLQPGARIVSHCSHFDDWLPLQTKIVPDEEGVIHTLRLWHP